MVTDLKFRIFEQPRRQHLPCWKSKATSQQLFGSMMQNFFQTAWPLKTQSMAQCLCLWSVSVCTKLMFYRNSWKNLTFSTYHNTHTHNRLTAFCPGLLSGTTRVGRYQKKHSPTHTHPDHRTSFIVFLQRSMASTLFILRAWQSSRTISLQVLFGLPLGLGPSTSYSIHFFIQSSSSFRSTYQYQRSLFCCNTSAMSSIPSLSTPYVF